MDIYTVGHSNRRFEEFMGLIGKYEIKTIVDVRSFPTSKMFPYFSRDNLDKELPKRGIRYIWMGDTLGGFRKGGYRAYTLTDAFKKAVEKLLEYASQKVAIMCAEKLPWHCHRQYLSLELKKRGIKCIHLLDEETTWISKDLTDYLIDE
ncbi:MAG TPA: DUF488 domain-containing protein [Candidatus Deferrimicrobium sp.]|nr:DUF488 domain-containing protein [Candidatus Deferrimicrobium sp.]